MIPRSGPGSTSFSYLGNWLTYVTDSQAYNATVHYTHIYPGSATIVFNGTQIRFFTTAGVGGGMNNFSIDNGIDTLIDCYSAIKKWQQPVYTSMVLPRGNHSLKVSMTKSKNPASTGNYLFVDKVEIRP